MATPSQPRVTLPLSLSWVTTDLAKSIGMAKPMPMLPPLWLKIAELIPTTSPFRLSSGPPELPGLIEASVWMKSSYGPAPITRPLALTMPAVTVCSRPKGLPMAMTQSPTWRSVDLPKGTTGNGCLTLILIRAISVFSSEPTTLASYSSLSERRTVILSASPTTWLLVMMYPSSLTMKPEPRLRCWPGGGRSPKKRRKNSSKGSSPPNGFGPGPGMGKGGVRRRRSTFCVVEILTTAGEACLAVSDKDGSELDRPVGAWACSSLLPEPKRSSAKSGDVSHSNTPVSRATASALWLLNWKVCIDFPSSERSDCFIDIKLYTPRSRRHLRWRGAAVRHPLRTGLARLLPCVPFTVTARPARLCCEVLLA